MWSQLVSAAYLSPSDHFLVFTKLPADRRPRHLATFFSFRRLHFILQSYKKQSTFGGNQSVFDCTLKYTVSHRIVSYHTFSPTAFGGITKVGDVGVGVKEGIVFRIDEQASVSWHHRLLADCSVIEEIKRIQPKRIFIKVENKFLVLSHVHDIQILSPSLSLRLGPGQIPHMMTPLFPAVHGSSHVGRLESDPASWVA